MQVELRKRSLPERLRWLAEKLDREGDREVIRFAVSSALLVTAVELEMTAQCEGTGPRL